VNSFAVKSEPWSVLRISGVHWRRAARGVWLPGSLDKQAWATLAGQAGVLTSEHWLLAYEAHRQGWIVVPATAQDPVFGSMLSAGVSFFDSTLYTPMFPDAALGLPGGALPDYYA